MKRVNINKGFAGLVTRKNNYKRILTEGSYWLIPGETVTIYDLAKPFYPSIELNVLLRDSTLAELLTIVEVADNEIALEFINGNFKNVLTAGKYAFWKGVNEFSFIKADLNKNEITDEINRNLMMRPELLGYLRIYSVEWFEKGMLMVDGKKECILEPGTYYFWKNSTPLSVVKTDLREQQVELSGQELLSRDKATIRVSFMARYKVVDILKALNSNKDYEKQLYIALQLSLREFIGMYSLDELLERKGDVSEIILAGAQSKIHELGVELIDCGIKDVILPGDMKEIMNQVLVAEKKAQANVIMRREETASTRNLLNTARLMEENNMLFRLKEMEYVEKIAERINNISLNGNAQILDQLKTMFIARQ